MEKSDGRDRYTDIANKLTARLIGESFVPYTPGPEAFHTLIFHQKDLS